METYAKQILGRAAKMRVQEIAQEAADREELERLRTENVRLQKRIAELEAQIEREKGDGK